MDTKNKVLDDMARLAGGTVSLVSGLGNNIRAEIKSRVEEIVDRLDLVPRADLERTEAMVQKMRLEQEELIKRIEKLEAAQKPKSKKTTTTK